MALEHLTALVVRRINTWDQIIQIQQTHIHTPTGRHTQMSTCGELNKVYSTVNSVVPMQFPGSDILRGAV